MASYRPFPSQNTLQPPPPPPPSQQPSRPNQYAQNYPQMAPLPPRPQHYPAPPPRPPSQYPYQPPPPPPPQQQPLQPGMYYPPPNSQFSQYGHHQPQQPIQPPPPPPPPPPSSPPPSSSVPPPPPPSSPPPPPPPKEGGLDRDSRVVPKERVESGHHKPQVHVDASRKGNGLQGRVETEEERRLRKKKEFEKQRQEEKRRQQMKESLQKTHASSHKGHGSIVGSRMGDKRATPLLGGERMENNRLKKPTTFVCKLKFRNELPDPSAQPKLMKLKRDPDRFTKYTITSLEKIYKPELHVEPDLGIPLDLLDLSVYNRPANPPPLDPEDEELLRDDDLVPTPKKDGIKRKDRPTDKGVSWLVKTQYISSHNSESTKQSLTEKQAKELREMKERSILEGLNDRERQIKEIEASFEACKLRPVHATNKNLKPVEILPLLPDFDRYDDKFVMTTFDSAPTADSEVYGKLDQSVRDACEARAIMKACVATGSDPANPDKFLAYMAPKPDELSKDMDDENEDTTYSWVREYHWDVRGDDANDPSTFLVSFDDKEARYVPLPTKLTLRKRRPRDGKSNDEIEQFPAPSKVTVRPGPVAATRELRDPLIDSSSKGKNLMDHSSGAEDDFSE